MASRVDQQWHVLWDARKARCDTPSVLIRANSTENRLQLRELQPGTYMFRISASPNSEHFTFVAPSIRRAKS